MTTYLTINGKPRQITLPSNLRHRRSEEERCLTCDGIGQVDVLTGAGGPDGSKGRIATDAGATPGAGR